MCHHIPDRRTARFKTLLIFVWNLPFQGIFLSFGDNCSIISIF